MYTQCAVSVHITAGHTAGLGVKKHMGAMNSHAAGFTADEEVDCLEI